MLTAELEERVAELETERLRRGPAEPSPLDAAFRALLAVIAAECQRAGYLPRGWRPQP